MWLKQFEISNVPLRIDLQRRVVRFDLFSPFPLVIFCHQPLRVVRCGRRISRTGWAEWTLPDEEQAPIVLILEMGEAMDPWAARDLMETQRRHAGLGAPDMPQDAGNSLPSARIEAS